MDRAAASKWAIDLLTGSLIDSESKLDPPGQLDPVMRTRARAFRTAFPDMTVTLHHLMVDGDWVAVHATGGGRHTAAFQGCPATGRAWSATCTAIFQVAHDQIVHGWVTWDLLAILEQLGAVERSATVSA